MICVYYIISIFDWFLENSFFGYSTVIILKSTVS